MLLGSLFRLGLPFQYVLFFLLQFLAFDDGLGRSAGGALDGELARLEAAPTDDWRVYLVAAHLV